MKITKQMQLFRSKAFAVMAVTCLWALLAAPLHAGLIMSINPSNTNAAAGSTGDFFDVILTNTTSATPGVAGFSFSLTAGNANIVFTGATTAAPSYVFAGDSFDNDFNSGVIRTSPDGQTLLASDFTSSGLDVTLAGNTAVGLGRVFFRVLSTASAGPIAINIDNTAATSLSNARGDALPLGTSVNGTVTVTVSNNGTPEPGTACLLLLALPALTFFRKRRNRSSV
jgi:hypothetical protein